MHLKIICSRVPHSTILIVHFSRSFSKIFSFSRSLASPKALWVRHSSFAFRAGVALGVAGGVLKTCTFVKALLLMDVAFGSQTAIASPLMDFIYSTAQVLITLRSWGPAVSDTLNMDRVTFVLLYGRERYMYKWSYIQVNTIVNWRVIVPIDWTLRSNAPQAPSPPISNGNIS